MMRSVFFVFALLVSTACASASGVPEELLRVQKEYQKSTGISAQFEQNTEVKSTRSTKKSQGRIWIKRPDKLRWETISPDPNILVSDGKTFWFYTPPFEKGDRVEVKGYKGTVRWIDLRYTTLYKLEGDCVGKQDIVLIPNAALFTETVIVKGKAFQLAEFIAARPDGERL